MLDKEIRKLMAQEEKMFGIAPGFKVFSPYPFGGINQMSSARQGMPDQEFWFLENFIKTGDGCLRTVWDQGTAVYTAPLGKTIVYYEFFNIGANNYVAIFLNDGTAIQVNTDTGVNVTISAIANTFYNSSISTQIPVANQWGSTYLLIANNFATNNYWVWDGTNLYQSGTLAPSATVISGGSAYTSAPTVTAFGGSGSGATFTAIVLNGVVVNVQVTSPGSGYTTGDNVQLAFSGGGSDTSAVLIASLSTGSVGAISVSNGGQNYTSPIVTITGGGGTGATATATLSDPSKASSIASITVTNGGSNYTSTPTISISGGAGTGATAIATLNPGGVGTITVSNGGSGYNSTPTLTIVGGGGTGATAVATVSGGVITGATVTNVGIGYTSVPSVVVQSGINRAASATVSLMPFGISGTSIETFQQHVWIGYPHQASNGNGVLQNGAVFNVSTPGSFTNFATSAGGLQFTSSDSFLRAQYVNFKQSNGYLYAISDSAVSVISNVQTSGNPATTTFNYQNTDPQTGTSWRDSLQAYSRTLIFANVFGAFGLYGGAVTKISPKMDNIFNNAIFPASGGVVPTSAVANIFNLKIYLLNITIKDPITLAQRTVMIGWDEKEWYVFSQASTFNFIRTQEINSNMIAWGTDGTSLYRLFNQASATLSKRLSSKLYGQNNFLVQKESMGVYAQVQDLSTDTSGVVFSSIAVDAEHGSYAIPSIPAFPSTPPPYYAILSMGSGDVTGTNLGLALTSTSKDFTINFLGLGYIETGSLAMASQPIVGQISTQ